MTNYSMKSTVKEIYASPVGKDVLDKVFLQANLDKKKLLNPLTTRLSLKAIQKLTLGKLPLDFFETLLYLLNSEPDQPLNDKVPIEPKWWKEAIFYQIYPRSFKDSDGDGIGDLQGIIQKLDYLNDLGITALWLSPIYDSPNDDNGYDIRNYRAIMQEFGTMADFDQLLSELKRRDMKLIMDLVINHTSDEHPWFQAALADPASPYRDYYFFHDNPVNQVPNNWVSFFSGPAWKYLPEQKKWVLHLFSAKQMDLNWDNPALRADVIEMIQWWHDKGVDGFRLDVVNYISKNPGLPAGNQFVGELMSFTGIEQYFYGINLHKYLHQMKVEAFEPYDAFSVGETPGIGMEMGKLLTGDYRRELDMFFNFDQLENPGYERFDDYVYDLNYLKTYYTNYQENFGNHYWMSLFYDNHDNPRMLAKVRPPQALRAPLAKLLAILQFTLKGTPFIFQGQELGLVNQAFTSMAEIRDVESLNLYAKLTADGVSHEDAFAKILRGTRDHARTPMPWSPTTHAGFSSQQPWLFGDDDYLTYNVASEAAEPDSILAFYHEMLAIRKAHRALIYGEFENVMPEVNNYFGYYRRDGAATYFIELNLSAQTITRPYLLSEPQLLISNYQKTSQVLRPYEGNVYRIA